jgi:hypothetical protein
LDFHQAGVLLSASLILRGKEDIRGNGHMMMLEKNSAAVAARIENWLDKALPERAASR